MKDFFISYTQKDVEWATWVAYILEQNGYTTIIQAWDHHASEDFVQKIKEGLENTKQTIAILSNAYHTSKFGMVEYIITHMADINTENRNLIPIRVEACTMPAAIARIIYIDLVDSKDEKAAIDEILKHIKGKLREKRKTPIYPKTKKRPIYPKYKIKKIKRTYIFSILIVLLFFCISYHYYHTLPYRLPADPNIEFLKIPKRVYNKTQPHKPYLPTYYMAKFEISNQQFQSFCKHTGYINKANRNPEGFKYYNKECPDCPIVDITPKDALEYCKWLQGNREDIEVNLPSVQQWKYAYGGLKNRTYPWGNSINCKAANYSGYNNIADYEELNNTTKEQYEADGFCYLAPVQSFSEEGASEFGIINMAGNAWEWCLHNQQTHAYGGGWDSTAKDISIHGDSLDFKTSSKIGFRPVINFK